jgi:hypothetical protein
LRESVISGFVAVAASILALPAIPSDFAVGSVHRADLSSVGGRRSRRVCSGPRPVTGYGYGQFGGTGYDSKRRSAEPV